MQKYKVMGFILPLEIECNAECVIVFVSVAPDGIFVYAMQIQCNRITYILYTFCLFVPEASSTF